MNLPARSIQLRSLSLCHTLLCITWASVAVASLHHMGQFFVFVSERTIKRHHHQQGADLASFALLEQKHLDFFNQIDHKIRQQLRDVPTNITG